LPHTPPRKVEKSARISDILGLDALAPMKTRSFAVFIISMFLICIPLYFYFVMMGIYLAELQWTGIAAKMSLAQISDVIFLFLLPIMLRFWGYKKTILVGIFAWAFRYFLLQQSVGAVDLETILIIGAVLLHGVCYDFLFIAGQLYVDTRATDRNRSAMQGFIAFILWGLGAFVGTLLAGIVLAAKRLPEARGTILHDWSSIWSIPALGAAVILVVFFVFFREPPAPTIAIAGNDR